MLSFEEFKKLKEQNGGVAPGSQQKQNAEMKSSSRTGVMTFEEWKAWKKQLQGQPVRPPAPRQTNAQIVANARKSLQTHQAENQQKWDKWKRDYEEALAAVEAALNPVQPEQGTAEAPAQAERAEAAAIGMQPMRALSQNNGFVHRTKAMEQAEEFIKEKQEQEQLETLLNAAQKNLDVYLESEEHRNIALQNMAAKGAALIQGSGVSTGTFAAPQKVQEDVREKELRAVRDYYKNLFDEQENKRIMEADLAAFERWPMEDQVKMHVYIDNGMGSFNSLMGAVSGDAMAKAYTAQRELEEKYGADVVDRIMRSLSRNKNQKFTEEMSALGKETGNRHPILGSAATVNMNLFGTMASPLGYLSEAIRGGKGQYQTLDPNNIGNLPNVYTSTVRGQVAENISGDQYDENGNLISDGGMIRQGLATVYGAGMSAADNLARIFVSGGDEVLSLGLAATGSFGQTVSRMSAQGASPEQAVAMGIVSGGLEVITEKVSLDNLFKQAKIGPKNLWYAIGGAMKAGGIEVSEEELNFLCSTIAEAGIMRGKSAYNQQVQRLMVEQGMSYEKAVATADATLLAEAANTAVESFLSGNIMGDIAQAKGAYQTAKLGMNLEKQLGEEGVQSLIDDALKSGDKDLQKKIEAGEMPTSYELARMYQEKVAAEEAEREKATGDADERTVETELTAAEENPTQEPEKVRISDSGTAMLASPVGVENTREQLAEAKRVAAEYGVDINLYTEYDTERESYVEDGEIYINTESKTPFEAIVQGYIHEQAQPTQMQVEPTAPAVIQSEQNVIEEAQNAQQQEENVTAAPVSVAAQIRQNQNLNGGNIYETDTADSAAADAGAGVLHGSGQRYDGARAGEPAGGMAGGTRRAAAGQAVVDQRRATIDRGNRIGALRLAKISSAELGISSGTDARNIQLVPQEHWDGEMEQLAERIYQETGKNVSYVMGKIQIRGKDGRVRNVNGVVYGDRIVVRADHLRLSMEQIADHEAYHGRVSYFGNRLNEEIRKYILEKFSAEEFQSVVTKYVEAMQGIYSAEELQSGEASEQLMNHIQEEIFADAYAGINAFGAGADRFTAAVNEKMEQLGLGRFRSEENGVRETNGPPMEMTGQKENTAGYGGEMYSVDIGDAIYPGMDDSERTEILMQKEIRVPIYDDSNPVNGAHIIKLKGEYVTGARSILTELARQCGAFQSDFYNAEINLDFAYSNKSLKESVSKQAKRGGGAEEFGKMLTVLPEICKNAVEIEAHTDRYVETARADEHLKEMHILLGAFFDGMEIVPVQLEIKEFLPKSNQRNKLYVTVTIKEAGVTPRGPAANMASVSIRSRPASVISLSELLPNVKDRTGDLVKYFPDAMLTGEQRKIKADALMRDEKRIKNMRYEYAVENQNTEKAESMLREKAAEQGYSAENEYRMAHYAPGHQSGVSLVDADQVYGGDGSIYSAAAEMYYGEGRSYDGKAITAFKKAHFNPDSSITVYRAVPADVQDTKLRNGDWVSPTREYAREHGERTFDEGYRIVSQKVPVRHLYVNGDSIHEFGYDNGRANEVYKNTRNNVKLAEITYDDAGQLIPLSQRYDESVVDERYSVDDESDETDYASVQAAMSAQGKEWSEMYLRDQLGDEGYEKYREWEKQQAEQKNQQSRERSKQRNAEKQAARNSVTKPVAESRPIEAKRELRNTLLDTFSVPTGSRGQLGDMIDSYADRLIKNGTLTEDDRRHFFDRMYDAGVMTVPADDYFSEGRGLLTGGRVYVPESVKADFGDDWNDIRRRAFGARIYFTSDRSAAGIDSWNHELASELPGLFDENETDMRSILERIVDVAEEGRDEKMSLAEYTAMLADRGEISEEEFLDDMERKLDEALRTFAKQAKLEVKLRNRTGIQIAKERAEHREMSQRQRDRAELRELQQRTLKTLQWLNKNRNRAPEELQAAFDEVLSDIDIYAVGAANEMRWSDRYNATWKDLAQMYKDAMKNDPNFLPSKELEMIVGRLDGTKIADMDLGALNDLYKAAVGLRTEFYNRNNVINDEMQRLFEEVYADAKREIESAPGKYTGKKMDKLLNLAQLTPMNVLQRMGGWDPNGTFYAMAKQLEKGERDMRAYSVKAKRMLQDFLTEHEEWVKKADGQGKDGIWYEVEIPQLIALEVGKKPQFGATVKVSMTPVQKVHMYLESKNIDNLRHMTGGRTFADKELYSEGKRQEALAQGRTIRMAPETVKAIVADLTEEEMELARLLEQYYNSFATKEINRVSNILYGYDKAMGKNYAPIYTNRNYTKAEFGVFDQTAEGVGNLKGRQYAVNPSYNISALDAFERHVDQTARFVGMAIPARNWTTLMNWRVSNNSTADVITHKWGEEGKRYITDLITKLQSGDDVETDPISSMANKLQSTYITAIFGANPSIVLKQLGSIPLASAYLDARNVPKVSQIKSIDRELISRYTQDLEWRTMGYSMPETKVLKDNPNWTQTNKFYNFTFGGGAITAMDGWAASVLWPWAENKVRADFPELEMGTQEQIQNGESPFYKKVAELFEDALARSQSTSDEIHQSSLRKSKNPIARAFTMFRSDSAQTYNTLRQKIGEAQYHIRNEAKEEVLKAAKQAVGAAFVSLLMNALWSESINFLMALWKNKGKNYRDEEEELTFQSVAGEMVSSVLGSFAGIVAGGEEILEIIGNLLTGEKIYDIEAPGIEQLNDVIAAVTSAGGSMREVIAGAVKVAVKGGDVGQYFKENGRDILGSVKDLAETVAMYMPGLLASGIPVSNIEAYLMGAVKWISPELGAAYDDLWQNIDKNDLNGLAGGALEGRVKRILRDRSVSKNKETAKTLAGLYEAGFKKAIPGKIPSSVTIDGESKELDTVLQNKYSEAWGDVVAERLDELVSSGDFRSAEPEVQEKMLSYLYTYAGEMAKAQMFEGYEPKERAGRFTEMTENGVSAELAHDVQMEMYKLDAADAGDVEYWRLAVNSANVEETQMAIMGSAMDDDQFKKLTMAQKLDVSPDMFVTYYEKRGEHDADKNGSYSNAEVQAVIDAMGKGYTKEQKGVLWQMATGSTSTKNNPYSKEAGQKWLDEKAKAKEKE